MTIKPESKSQLSRLLWPTRLRSLSHDLWQGLPLALLVAVVIWRFHGLGAALLIAALVFGGVVGTALWRLRRYDRTWLVRRLNSLHPEIEDSADLLFATGEAHNLLQVLQGERIQQRLTPTTAVNLRQAFDWRRIGMVWAVSTVLTVVILIVPLGHHAAPITVPVSVSTPSGPPQMVAQSLQIEPPAYTGLTARTENALNVKLVQGSRLTWRLRFKPDTEAVDLIFHDGTRLGMTRSGADWIASRTFDKSVLYRVSVKGVAPLSPLYRLDVTPDAPPQIKIITPDRALSLVTPGQRTWPLTFEASDDYGVRPEARMRLTLAQGEGENVTLRESTILVPGTGGGRQRRFSVQLDLTRLGFAMGDDLVAQLIVSDNRTPNPQIVRSPSLILRWPSDLGTESSALEGMVKKTLPAYFRSQRQIIIDAEALLKEKRKLSEDTFLSRSDSIGVDQRVLRLRYGQFLGEESEVASKPPPTSDTESHEETATNDTHDHDEPSPAPQSGFGADSNVLEEFGHTHDEAEAATLLEPETRATLKKALDEMWQSELHLRQGHPERALPHAYKALGFIKEVQQATRIFLARVGPDLPPIDEARRMTGKRDGLASRQIPVVPKEVVDAAPVAVWRDLDGPPDQRQLDALEQWLRLNEARVPDPLAFVSAIDAVRRDPGCTGCRKTLRALLWTVLSRPAVQVQRRDDGGVGGKLYLEALQSSGQEASQ